MSGPRWSMQSPPIRCSRFIYVDLIFAISTFDNFFTFVQIAFMCSFMQIIVGAHFSLAPNLRRVQQLKERRREPSIDYARVYLIEKSKRNVALSCLFLMSPSCATVLISYKSIFTWMTPSRLSPSAAAIFTCPLQMEMDWASPSSYSLYPFAPLGYTAKLRLYSQMSSLSMRWQMPTEPNYQQIID